MCLAKVEWPHILSSIASSNFFTNLSSYNWSLSFLFSSVAFFGRLCSLILITCSYCLNVLLSCNLYRPIPYFIRSWLYIFFKYNSAEKFLSQDLKLFFCQFPCLSHMLTAIYNMIYAVVHGAMGCGQKSFKFVWRYHELLSGFLNKATCPECRVSHVATHYIFKDYRYIYVPQNIFQL